MEAKKVISEVSLFARVPISTILSKSRKYEIVSLRALIVKVLLKKGYTLKSTADALGYKDHTSIMNLRDGSHLYDSDIDLILERL